MLLKVPVRRTRIVLLVVVAALLAHVNPAFVAGRVQESARTASITRIVPQVCASMAHVLSIQSMLRIMPVLLDRIAPHPCVTESTAPLVYANPERVEKATRSPIAQTTATALRATVTVPGVPLTPWMSKTTFVLYRPIV